MTAYLLDTNHLSPFVTLEHPLRIRILEQLENGDSFSTCTPIVTELLFGIGTLPRAKITFAEWQRLRPFLFYYTIEERDAELVAELQISLRKRGRQLETADAMIAAIALRNELTILTTDNDFKSVPGLLTKNWRTSEGQE